MKERKKEGKREGGREKEGRKNIFEKQLDIKLNQYLTWIGSIQMTPHANH